MRTSTAVLVALGLLVWSPYGVADHEVQPAAPAVPGPVLHVTTLNIAKEVDAGRILREWKAVPGLWNSDVLLLQEVIHFAAQKPSVAHLLAQQMGYFVVSEPNIPGRDTDGLAILSRYPLKDSKTMKLPHMDLGFRTRSRIMIAATVDSPAGQVRVYNVHLDTRINSEDRLKQLAPALADADAHTGPEFIAGDFNTNYMHWLRNMVPVPAEFQGRAVQHAMEAKGFRTPFSHTGPTFDHFGFQLDWVYSRGMTAYQPRVQPLAFSDHHALLVTLRPDPAR